MSESNIDIGALAALRDQRNALVRDLRTVDVEVQTAEREINALYERGQGISNDIRKVDVEIAKLLGYEKLHPEGESGEGIGVPPEVEAALQAMRG